jgi:hypothetical protein
MQQLGLVRFGADAGVAARAEQARHRALRQGTHALARQAGRARAPLLGQQRAAFDPEQRRQFLADRVGDIAGAHQREHRKPHTQREPCAGAAMGQRLLHLGLDGVEVRAPGGDHRGHVVGQVLAMQAPRR